MKKQNILCTICARAGSKGIKDKNIYPLMGQSLIAYTLKQAIKWGKASRVVVSTDSEKIAKIARRYGAEVPFLRPKHLATDTVPKIASIRHAFRFCERLYNETYDIVVDLDITSPIRKIKDLDNCLIIFNRERPYTLFSAVRAQKNPYFNMVEKNKSGYFEICKKLPGGIFARQNAPDVYSMNASIYFYSRDFLINIGQNTPFTKRTLVYLMDDVARYDIDDKLDFLFIEFLLKKGIWKNEV